MIISHPSTSSSSVSWINIDPESDFSLQNFPFGIYSIRNSSSSSPRCCSAIGSFVIDLSALANEGIFDNNDNDDKNNVCFLDARNVFASSSLNAFMSKSRGVWKKVRLTLIDLLTKDGKDDRLSSNLKLQETVLIPLTEVTMHLPATIGDYTDFYSSREHATNVGTMFRGKENALGPNWLHLPIGYHGRASSVFVSGTDVVRPSGQLQTDPKNPKLGSFFGPCEKLDFELEMAFFVGGAPNIPGTAISMENANDYIFGFTLMNDWSARDIQKWEYVPLGPFGSKNFATTISPWIVTVDALEPFICPTSSKVQLPHTLEYLVDPNYSSYDIKLIVQIQGKDMEEAVTISQSNYANMYWNARQQLVHHSVTGCWLRPGDLMGSGTISGSHETSFGSMLELSWNGQKAISLGPNGKLRTFLEDMDNVIMKGWCQKDGIGRVGFGSCTGRILPVGTSLKPGPAIGNWVSKENSN